MRRSTMSILFFIKKNAPKKNGLFTIMIRVTLDGNQIQFSSRLEINPNHWDQKSNKATGRSEEVRTFNKMLDSIRMDLYSIYRDLANSKIKITPLKIKQAFIGQGEQTALSYIFKEHIGYLRQRIGKTISEVTCIKYERTLERLLIFIFKNYGAKDIQISTIDLRFLELFFLHLLTNYECTHNTAMRYMQRFASVMNYAERIGVVGHNPFMHYRIHFKPVESVSLSQSEVNKIYEKKFHTHRLVEVRDVFIFCCYSGLSFGDVFNLKKTDITTTFDCKEWVFIRRAKTDVVAHIPLLKIPCDIIDKYRVSHNEDTLFPMKCNQKTNEYLKEIADLCGITKNLTFHVARYTFANLMLNYGVSLESLGRMMGHRTIRTTQGYAKITDRRVMKEMAGVEKELIRKDPNFRHLLEEKEATK